MREKYPLAQNGSRRQSTGTNGTGYSVTGLVSPGQAGQRGGGRVDVRTWASGPNGDMIFLTNRDKKSVQIITLDYLAAIDLAGSPTKGPASAPVVVAIFSDFQ